MKKLISILLLSAFLFGANIFMPAGVIKVNGTAKDMVLRDNKLIIATDMGHIEIYDSSTKEKIKDIYIPDVTDFMGDKISARVMSTDFLDDQYLILSDSGKGGYSDLYIYKDEKLLKLLGYKDKQAIVKARFVDKDHILLGYLSDEASLYDMKNKKFIYKTQLSQSKFSDFMLNENRTKASFSSESGIISLLDVKNGKVISELSGQNVDNVYKTDFKSGTISGAGQDRRGSIYDEKSGKGTYIEGEFLIYGTALSPSAKKVAFAMDEKNNISIYDTVSKSKIALLKGQKSTLNVIIFQDENRLFSASDDSEVMIWNMEIKN
ncbi:Periplasmic nitrate reductase component NapL [hydrothermal vent metagenome]|uniref:Periplasmic nitrate reductase component NapL n=1 Tax=hydrothermal vent metagenome TaxID=652676 RepID=A0A1W1EG23_9ZZZZ